MLSLGHRATLLFNYFPVVSRINLLILCRFESSRPVGAEASMHAIATGLDLVVLHLIEAGWNFHEPTMGPVVEESREGHIDKRCGCLVSG